MKANEITLKVAIGLVQAALLPLLSLADFPAATYSLTFDGAVGTPSSVIGGVALPISQSAPKGSDYIPVRDGDTDKAFVGSDTAQPWHEGLDAFQQGGWSMLAVARGAEVANGAYWDVGWCAWQETNPAGWCTGFSLIRTAAGETALVRRARGRNPETILSARVENDTAKFHAYLVTHNPNAAGTEDSPYFVLYVDGVKVAQSTTLFQVWRNGYQFCGVYGGAPNASLANGVQFAIDEIGIWQTELSSAEAAEVCALYPVWPNVSRHAATMEGDATFSGLAWTPDWTDSSTTIGRISATDGACLTVDTAPTAYALEIASTGDFKLTVGEGGSLENVSSFNLVGIPGMLRLDATTFPWAGCFQLADSAVVRVEDTAPVQPPVTEEGYLALLNKNGQALEIAAPLVVPTVGGSDHLQIGQTEGVQNILLDAGSSVDADRLTVGAYFSASVRLVQKAGDVVLKDGATALAIAAYPLSDSSYTLLGGVCDVSSGDVRMGIEGSEGVGLQAALTIGGGETAALMKAGGIWSHAWRNENHVVTLKDNGMLELGAGGIDLQGPNGRVVLEGGLLKSVASASIRAAGGIQVAGTVTVDVPAGQILRVAEISGAGTLVKTGGGMLLFLDENREFTGAVDVREGVREQAERVPWFDFSFSRSGLPDRAVSSRNVRNDGYAGSSAVLLLDGAWTGLTGYDAATGLLKLQTTPCRDMTDVSAWPSRWTVALAAQVPGAADLCLLGLGSTYFTSQNYLALATGVSPGSLRLVMGHGHAAGETLAEMSIPPTSSSTRHLFVLTYDGTTCTVYHADGSGGIQTIGCCPLPGYELGGGFQVGSIHGGVAGTGLNRADEVVEAEACGIRAVRIFETALSAEALGLLEDELVRQHGTQVLVR